MINKDALSAFLSGITTKKNDKEIWWRDDLGRDVTVEIIDNASYVVRFYGNKKKEPLVFEHRYKNGQLHGRCLEVDSKSIVESYCVCGKLHGVKTIYTLDWKKLWQVTYKNGKRHGVCIGWDDNGSKCWEEYYKNDMRHGTCCGWINGIKQFEHRYKNGESITIT